MKKVVRLVFGILVMVTLTNCQIDINIDEVIDQSSPIILTVNQTNPNSEQARMKTETIQVDSDKWKRLKSFTNNNLQDWKITPASYNPDFSVHQGNFRLLGWSKGSKVVIGFTDSKGKPVQYTKDVQKGELDFLLR